MDNENITKAGETTATPQTTTPLTPPKEVKATELIPPAVKPEPASIASEKPTETARPVTAAQLVTEPAKPGLASWTCPKCGKGPFTYRSFLAKHIKQAHKTEADTIIAQLPASLAKPATPIAPGQAPLPGLGEEPDFTDISPLGANQGQQQPQEPTTPPVNYDAMAGALFDMTTGLLTASLGPEWQPRAPEEKTMVVQGVAAYMRAKGMDDIPPGLMLTFVITAYAGPRLAAPPTRSKLQLAWAWLRSKLSKRKFQFQPSTLPQP